MGGSNCDDFYPRSPCGERRLPTALRTPHQRFLSTLSLRRATRRPLRNGHHPPNFYPRSPCGERPTLALTASTAPHFYPRSPCGERRSGLDIRSIGKDFYPRSPCGERLCFSVFYFLNLSFLSTLSLRRATPGKNLVNGIRLIFLSTLSLRRATPFTIFGIRSSNNFYPRSPCGERPPRHRHGRQPSHFYPRSPCGERRSRKTSRTAGTNFYPRSPCGERPLSCLLISVL